MEALRCVCSIPRSFGWPMTFVDGHECPGGVGKLVCPLLGGLNIFELVEP